jgi:hypothetical protein
MSIISGSGANSKATAKEVERPAEVIDFARTKADLD